MHELYSASPLDADSAHDSKERSHGQTASLEYVTFKRQNSILSLLLIFQRVLYLKHA